MPKELTHILFADTVAAGLVDGGSAWLGGLLTGTRPTYHYGAIAPDTLFYAWRNGGRSSPGQPPLVEIVHGDRGEDTALAIVEMLRRLRSLDQRSPDFAHGAAFAAGYLTHMALDMTLNPWVYAVTGQYYDADRRQRRRARAGNRVVKSWLDLHLAARHGVDPTDFAPLRMVAANKRHNLPALRLWGRCFAHSFALDRDLGPLLARSYSRHLTCLKLYPKKRLAMALELGNRASLGRLSPLVALFHPVDRSAFPRELIDHDGFVHPVTGLRQDDGFTQLWHMAQHRAEQFLSAADRYLGHSGDIDDLVNAVLGYSLNMGLPHCATISAEHFRPIPLTELWAYSNPGSSTP